MRVLLAATLSLGLVVAGFYGGRATAPRGVITMGSGAELRGPMTVEGVAVIIPHGTDRQIITDTTFVTLNN